MKILAVRPHLKSLRRRWLFFYILVENSVREEVIRCATNDSEIYAAEGNPVFIQLIVSQMEISFKPIPPIK